MKSHTFILSVLVALPSVAFAHEGAENTSNELFSVLPLQEIVMIVGIVIAVAIILWNLKKK